MDNVHHRFDAVDQLAISISIVFEFVCLFFEQLKDVIGSVAGLDLVDQRVLGRVYVGLLDIVGESCVEDGLERHRRDSCTVCGRDILTRWAVERLGGRGKDL